MITFMKAAICVISSSDISSLSDLFPPQAEFVPPAKEEWGGDLSADAGSGLKKTQYKYILNV